MEKGRRKNKSVKEVVKLSEVMVYGVVLTTEERSEGLIPLHDDKFCMERRVRKER